MRAAAASGNSSVCMGSSLLWQGAESTRDSPRVDIGTILTHTSQIRTTAPRSLLRFAVQAARRHQ
jgi:hypothetical protein